MLIIDVLIIDEYHAQPQIPSDALYLQLVKPPHANLLSSNFHHKQLWLRMHMFIITLFSGGSECSHKLQWTSWSLLSLQTRYKTWGGTHKTSPCRHPDRFACPPTGQSEYSPHSLEERWESLEVRHVVINKRKLVQNHWRSVQVIV